MTPRGAARGRPVVRYEPVASAWVDGSTQLPEGAKLESLLKTTDAQSAARPALLRRLAEDYVELEYAALREKTEAEVKRDALRGENPSEAAKQQAMANSRLPSVRTAQSWRFALAA